jgi:hypothetical protein
LQNSNSELDELLAWTALIPQPPPPSPAASTCAPSPRNRGAPSLLPTCSPRRRLSPPTRRAAWGCAARRGRRCRHARADFPSPCLHLPHRPPPPAPPPRKIGARRRCSPPAPPTAAWSRSPTGQHGDVPLVVADDADMLALTSLPPASTPLTGLLITRPLPETSRRAVAVPRPLPPSALGPARPPGSTGMCRSSEPTTPSCPH